MKASNFLDWVESWYSAIRWGTAYVGRRLVGVTGVFANAVVEGCNQAFYAGLPNHAQQSPDAADQVGIARALFKFSNEADDAWALRLQEAWDLYEVGGTSQALTQAVTEWGAALNPAYVGPPAHVAEESWARFSVYLPFGLTGWDAPYDWDGTAVYNETADALYNLTADGIDVDHLRRLVRKWAPARSKGVIRVPLVDLIYYDVSGAEYGDGSAYAGAADLVEFTI